MPLNKLKAKFLNNVLKAKPLNPEEVGPPIFLVLGSLADVTKKDAHSYVRGLAERYVVTPQMGRIHVQEDKDNNRFIYEIHEGGPERVILPSVMEALKEEAQVRITLAGGGYAHIEDTANELITLIFPSAKDANELSDEARPESDDIFDYLSDKRLTELFPEEKALPRVGMLILGMATVFFLCSVGAFTLHRSGIFSPDVAINAIKQGSVSGDQDSPILFMDNAQREAKSKSLNVHALKKENGAWSWELKP